MKVLVGCEFSGTVRDAFKRLGHDAWSCDLRDTVVPGKHIKGDVFNALNIKWDLVILHPPCTCICLSGNSTYGFEMPKHTARVESIKWTKDLWEYAKTVSPRVALENPKNVMGKYIGQHTQTIQPYEFGHPENKETWLWLFNLPLLKATRNTFFYMKTLSQAQQNRIHYMKKSLNRGSQRSITYPGIAYEMAKQWGSL